MPYFPPELITDIFRRLPVDSLLRFRSLSKPFRDLIDSADFINSHLNQSLKSNSHRSIVTGNIHDKPMGIDSIDKEILVKRHLVNNFRVRVVGTCNGLVCLSLGTNVVLWNPSTRKHMHLPASLIESGNDSVSVGKPVYGFGYDHVNDDFKVLRIANFMINLSYRHEVKVYSLKLNSWRRLEDLPWKVYFTRDEGVLVNDALHWVVTGYFCPFSPEVRVIISFNLVTERFMLVPHPTTYFGRRLRLTVGELGRRLCLTCTYDQGLDDRSDTWVMNSYGREDSWTMLFTVGRSVDIRKLEYLDAIAYSKDREQVLLQQEGGRVLCYDFKQNDVKDIRSPRYPLFFDACICTGSLVKLPGEAITDVASEKPEKKRTTTVVRRTNDDKMDNFWRFSEKRRKS